jgi:DNA-binding NarL/FixJ family response regulator
MVHVRTAQRVSVHLVGIDYLTDFGLEKLFEASGFVELTGTSSTGRQSIQRVRAERPDVVIVDAGVADDGMPATLAALLTLTGPPKVLVLADEASGAAAEAVLGAGASGYLVRGDTLEDIAAALRIAHRGGSVSSCQPARRAPGASGPTPDPKLALRFKAFNPREKAILRGILLGQTNAQIARPLHVSEATVKAQIAKIRQQLGVDNRIQIAVQAVQAGIGLVPEAEQARTTGSPARRDQAG